MYKLTAWRNDDRIEKTGDIQFLSDHDNFYGLGDYLSAQEYDALMLLLKCENFTCIEFLECSVDDFGWRIETIDL